MTLGSSALIVLALAISPTSALPKPVTLSSAQKQALVVAYRLGAHYGIGLVFAAVVWQESSLCKLARESKAHAHGCAQVRESAVIAVTGSPLPPWQLDNPALQDENMAIGARYLDLCLQRFGWPDGIGCYYLGPDAAAKVGHRRLVTFWYTVDVLDKLKQLRQLPLSED